MRLQNSALIFPWIWCANMLQVTAWGAAGHEITGTIAQMYLHPSTLPRICAMAYPFGVPPKDQPCHLATIATWADRIRGLFQYKWASGYHYVGGLNDWPPQRCLFGEDGWEGKDGVNVLGGIWNTTTWVKEGRDHNGEALKFLIHFLGDLHMPLHLTARDRGGNEIKVHFHRRITNLHSVWDSRLISNGILDTPSNYSRPLASPQVEATLRGAIYDPYVRSIFWEGLANAWEGDLGTWITCPASNSPFSPSNQVTLGQTTSPELGRWDDDFVCPYAWAKPTQGLNCQMVFHPDLNWPPNSTDPHPAIELDTPEYAGKIRKQRIVERLLAQGGIRTAAILNGLFADDDVKAAAGSKSFIVPPTFSP